MSDPNNLIIKDDHVMKFICNCAKCGKEEDIGCCNFPSGKNLCTGCYDDYTNFMLEMFLK